MPVNLLNLIKSSAEKVISKNPGIPEDKKSLAIQTATSSVATGLKDLATPENLSGLKNLLSGAANTPMIQGLESNVIGTLCNKVGISQGVASQITASLIPMVMNMLTSKSKEGVDVGSLLGGLGNLGGGGLQGMMHTIGNLFGGGK